MPSSCELRYDQGIAASFWATCSAQEHFLANMYLCAKAAVVQAGFQGEIDWQRTRAIHRISEEEFLREAAWVVLSSGMSEAVVSRVFPRLAAAFRDFSDAREILVHREHCRKQALKVFGHRGKIAAILKVTAWCNKLGISEVRARLGERGWVALLGLPYLGPVTSRHLAKNLGIPIAKPDRHLERVAAALPVDGVSDLCMQIGRLVGEDSGIVDLVLWRACVIGALRPH